MWWFVFQKMMTNQVLEIIIEQCTYLIVPNINEALAEEVAENCIAKIEFLWRALKFKKYHGPSAPPPFSATYAIKITLSN